jgi:hypothetical protein
MEKVTKKVISKCKEELGMGKGKTKPTRKKDESGKKGDDKGSQEDDDNEEDEEEECRLKRKYLLQKKLED